MTDKMKNLFVRTASGAVLVAVVFGAVLWSQWSLCALLAVLTVGGMAEFYALARKCGSSPQSVIGTVAGLTMLALGGFGTAFGFDVCLYGCCFLLLLLPVSFICELWRRSEHPLTNIAATVMGVLYVALPLTLLELFTLFIHHVGVHRWLLLGFIVIIWANDVFAYLIGWAFGRHPLCPRLSPKKSWEGFFGGVAGAVGVGLLVRWLVADMLGGGSPFGWDNSVGFWVGLALVASVAGVAGDLVESMFKRAAGVKDSGTLIPGHGGVLDRFDALLLATPFVFVYLLIVLLF